MPSVDAQVHGEVAPNYDFVIRRALELAGRDDARVLDYGCGTGRLVAEARRRGLNFEGADTYEGFYESWSTSIVPGARDAVRQIRETIIDAPDASYDVVVSNQVFEHVADPPPALDEIARVLKPGGVFLALFPTRDVWFEGHVGLYFVHWLQPWPRAQRRYCRAAHRLGFGYYTGARTEDVWVDYAQSVLTDAVVYHAMSDVRRWWRDAFGQTPRCDAKSYMGYRLAQSRFRAIAGLARTPVTRRLFDFVCRVRAGRVLVVEMAK